MFSRFELIDLNLRWSSAIFPFLIQSISTHGYDNRNGFLEFAKPMVEYWLGM